MRCPRVLFLLLLLPSLASAAPPGWWTDPETRIIDQYAQPSNYSPVNLGQLKHVAQQAKEYLDTALVHRGGAGPVLDELVNSFEKDPAKNYAPVNLGQLKAVAKPFYDRLREARVDTKPNLIARGYPADWSYDYPWDPTTPAFENYAPANLGQLKMVFSFDPDTDKDGISDSVDLDDDNDGLPDAFEISKGLSSKLAADAALDSDMDGVSNRQEYLRHTDPLDFYNGVAPVITVLAGSGQEVLPNRFISQPIEVQVTSAGGIALEFAPVEITAPASGGNVKFVHGNRYEAKWNNVTGMTGENGIVKIWLEGPAPTGGHTFQLKASTTIAQCTVVVNPTLGPNAPSNFQLAALYEGGTRLTWEDNSNDETGFEIERSFDQKNWDFVVTVPPDSTSYDVDFVVSGTVYYRVTSVNENP